MSINALLIANSNLLEVNGLRNVATNGFMNTATVLATLQDAKGVDVVGETWPFSLDYVPSSDGCYQAVLDVGLTIEKNKAYTLTVVVQGEGLDAKWTQQIKAKVRN